jgi:hypothetical protein
MHCRGLWACKAGVRVEGGLVDEVKDPGFPLDFPK